MMSKSNRRNGSISRSHLSVLLASTVIVMPTLLPLRANADSLPQGGSVQHGNVTINSSTGNMTVEQRSNQAIVNWNNFSVGQGNQVTFIQPNASSAILNRVTGSTTSQIAGSIAANGQVFLVNPNGIAITSTGSVQIGGGFVASSLNISDDDFLKGNISLQGNGSSAKVSNAGIISVGRGGYAALIGGTVGNDGLIAVPMGKIGLGSGEQATLDPSGDGFLQVALPTKDGAEGKGALIESGGSLSAEGGTIVMQAATAREAARHAINLSGVAEAKSVSGKNGSIVLGGGSGGTVTVSGKIRASSGDGKGGKVTVTGKNIALRGAEIDASGAKGGGEIKIGGDWQGKVGTERATNTTVDAKTRIHADATGNGNGGTVVVWSDEKTDFSGLITAKGAGVGGNGGDAEVSGKALLGFSGVVDLTAAQGKFGNLLLDPYNVVIKAAADANSNGFTASGNDSVINVVTLQSALATANVTVSTGSSGSQAGNISLESALSWAANTTLTLQAAGNIYINKSLTATGASAGLVLQYAWNKDYFVNAPITLSGANSTLAINGNNYTLIRSMADLEALNSGPNSTHYALAQSLDAAGKSYTAAVVGSFGSSIFAGLGNTISNLKIEKKSTDVNTNANQYYGLFGRNYGTIRDIGLVNAIISVDNANYSGTSLNVYAGLLSGNSTGTIKNSNASGSVVVQNSKSFSDSNYSPAYTNVYAGGLVGYVKGQLNNSYSSASVRVNAAIAEVRNINATTGSYANNVAGANVYAGGLFGYGDAVTAQNLYSTGAVTISGTKSYGESNHSSNAADVVNSVLVYVGGLAGLLNAGGSVVNAYSTGNVTISGTQAYGKSSRGYSFTSLTVNAGGLVGHTKSSINTAYSTGAVLVTGSRIEIAGSPTTSSLTGNIYLGGLVGNAHTDIQNVYATGSVTLSETTRAQVSGSNSDNGTSTSFYAMLGGLAALNADPWANNPTYAGAVPSTKNAYSTGKVSLTGNNNGLTGSDLAGLMTYTTGYVTATYFNTSTSGMTVGVARSPYYYQYPVDVTGFTTAQLQDGVSFTAHAREKGWDFSNVWAPSSSGNYAQLYALTPVVQVSIDNVTSTYGSTHAYTASVSGGPNKYVFARPNDSFLDLPLTSSATSASNVGDYSITLNAGTWTSANGTVYRIANQPVAGTLTINPAAITVTADAQSRSYGSANPALTYQITSGTLFNNDVLNGALTTAATTSSNVGTYAITKGSLANSNYAITFVGANLTVQRAALTVTANNQSKSYDGTNFSGFDVSYSGFVLGQDQSALNGSLIFSGDAITAVDAGNYQLVASGYSSDNYAISYVDGSLAISQAAITVTADALSRIYGSANPALTYQITSGQLFGQDSLSGSLATSANATSDVGQYAIAQGTLNNSNYAIQFVGSDLSVAKAALTVTANDKSKYYDRYRYAGVFDVQYDGFVLGQDETVLMGRLSFGGASQTTADVGDHQITPYGLTSNNYDITFVGGTLTISPLVISTQSGSSLYDHNLFPNNWNTLFYQSSDKGEDEGLTLPNALANNSRCISSSGWNPCGLAQ